MQQYKFPWVVVLTMGALLLALVMAIRSNSEQEALEGDGSATSTVSDGSLAPASGLDSMSAGSHPRGTESAAQARQERRELALEPRVVELSERALGLQRALEGKRRDFEYAERLADLPDELGEGDREYLRAEQLERVEESLDFAELEQQLAGAERSAVMFQRLATALGDR